jgi:UDP-N-acetylglucosamine--N-acetylmuramyl-(pentapeptide) pyrophosphoryl-undecaprenol N-acetylglucosamine transferase
MRAGRRFRSQNRGARRPRMMPHLVIMAAGTGGHIIPGLAVAREMQGARLERQLAGHQPRHGKPARAPRPASRWTPSASAACAARACCTPPPAGCACSRPSGTASHPAPARRRRGAGHGRLRVLSRWLMASLLGKPLMLVNADAALLLSNRSAAAGGRPRGLRLRRRRAARRRRTPSSPATRCAPRSKPCPRRPQRYAGRSGPLRLLVVGGSLGAQVLNRHRAGRAGADAGRRSARWSRTRPGAHLADRARRLRRRRCAGRGAALHRRHGRAQLAACDLMVCRAGAITVSELCAAGVPSLLVPLIVSAPQRTSATTRWMAGTAPRCTCRRPS